MTNKQIFCGGVVAGAIIACAGAFSTMAAASFPFMKALIFPFGLLLICYGRFALFTGNIYKIGRDKSLVLDDKFSLLIINYIANLIGTFLVSLFVTIPYSDTFYAKWQSSPFKVCLLAIACNFLVCLGVKLFKVSPVATYIAVALFVACGFEHSIADMYYFFCVPWSVSNLIIGTMMLAVITGGNIIGGLLVIKLEQIMEGENG